MKGETKEQRFKRVAEKRVQNVLDSIRKLSQCANKRMYEWNEIQLKTIWEAIDQEITKCKDRFESEEPEEFKL
ncbi:hypothetical protein ACFL4V_00635 [Candidatus Latescibacterota bacterium]